MERIMVQFAAAKRAVPQVPGLSNETAHPRQPLQGFAEMLNAHNHRGKQHKQRGAISNV